jgi:hypothetical protein
MKVINEIEHRQTNRVLQLILPALAPMQLAIPGIEIEPLAVEQELVVGPVRFERVSAACGGCGADISVGVRLVGDEDAGRITLTCKDCGHPVVVLGIGR